MASIAALLSKHGLLAHRLSGIIAQTSHCSSSLITIDSAELPSWVRKPERFDHVKYPPNDQALLPELAKTPFPDKKKIEHLKYVTKRLIDIRGPEMFHNFLIHKQYGLAAVTGGMLEYDHLETIRHLVNHHIKNVAQYNGTFGLWRVEAPFLPRSKKSKGSKMGGGKGKVHHFVTPVRSGRIICELGGQIVEDQARRLIEDLAHKLPFEARFVSHVMLEEEKANQLAFRQNNRNRYTWEFCMRWDMQNCSFWLSPYDYVWDGKYR